MPTSSQQTLSSALTALGDAITGLGPGLQAIASEATNAEAMAEAAIPKSLVGTAPGDVVVLDASGRLPAVDGSRLINLPSQHGVLPVLTIELGHGAQANGGRGIDKGNWYQLDFRIGAAIANCFQYTANDDGTITIPSGVYLVAGSAKILVPSTDTYHLPAQMVFATGQVYAFPGIYQYAVQQYPDAPISSTSVSGVLGSLRLSGVQANWGSVNPLWMGFAKVLGSQNQTPLALQGYMSIVKTG
ncbi:hypothetical protein [Burkholderia sola]|uniref:hypothetical protein n=1 Tax=Burkholderia sola TaxID=2843302 RepID=UPI001C0A8831|nr:hypothetical protein BCCR75389_01242 [Burkholderia cenocepacia]CAG2266300.1 hypothetical protein BCCR75386_01257 [Burkholderia cenocepacia]CAG2266488.1 hypothetical protein BCCR75388_01258 [Burkholderia cenocepacia]CAG2266675.1 hypothetical protein BCCR75384_01257 [Burkholderia cenocepacia]CAG2266724.1 hypothetical protein BCCR75387_01257 [Burkholderia cenocepacia]